MENTASRIMMDYVNSHNSSSTDEIIATMKDLFRDALQQVMEGELEDNLGHEKRVLKNKLCKYV